MSAVLFLCNHSFETELPKLEWVFYPFLEILFGLCGHLTSTSSIADTRTISFTHTHTKASTFKSIFQIFLISVSSSKQTKDEECNFLRLQQHASNVCACVHTHYTISKYYYRCCPTYVYPDCHYRFTKSSHWKLGMLLVIYWRPHDA